MSFYADLHVHSKYSRATSRDCDLEHLAWWAARKGIAVVGTGDFTHPAWFEELRTALVPAEPGLFRLREDLEREVAGRLPPSCNNPVRFLLSVEISTIYKRAGRTRKVHHLVYAPDLETVRDLNRRLGRIGNIGSDGRPILGLDSRDLLDITLTSGDGAYLVPAHVWTPWFAVLGSMSGFDTIFDCYADLAGHVFAIETGLSSDPAMNWRVSGLDRYRLVSNSDAHSPPMLGREATVFATELDYFAIRAALETGEGFGGTVEFFPEEGKYHLDGHRKCGVRLEPAETRRLQGTCPACAKPLTVGVMHRVEALADREDGFRVEGAAGFRSLVPLPEIVGEIVGVGSKSKRVEREVAGLVARLGPELDILERLPLEEIRTAASPLVAEAIGRMRSGNVIREAGYDGEYGRIHLFSPEELRGPATVALFAPDPAPAVAPSLSCVEDSADVSPEPSGQGRCGNPPPPDTTSLLAGLDPEQRAAATASGPLLIIAGPGTGKTRTLTHRLAYLLGEQGVPPESCLAVTFTRRACEELAERLKALVPEVAERLTVTTFHGLGLQIVREQHHALGLGADVRIADEAERLALLRDVLDCPASAARRLGAELSARKRAGDLDETLRRYEEALRDRGLVDFDDLVALPVQLFDREPTIAAAYRERWEHIAVDEYQDVDGLQYRLLRHLAPPDGDLCAIGDPDQAIYGFRGGDVGFFLRFSADFPAARTVLLTRNYRSSPVIVAGALQAIEPESLVPGRTLEACAPDEAPTRIVVAESATERGEAEFVVHTIDRLLGGSSHFSIDSGRVDAGVQAALGFADFAVLARTDAQLAALVEALDRAGMPFQKRSHDRLADRPGVETVVSRLRREDGQRPPGDVTPVAVLLRQVAVAVANALDGDVPDGESATLGEIDAAVDLLSPLAERCGPDLDRFLAELALGAEVDTLDPRADRVSLLTLHAAKGLEFPVVFIVGCEDGLLPLRWAGGDRTSDTAEERRLFFVGMTRARARLLLCSARRRLRHGTVAETTPSPFLEAIDPTLLQRLAVEAPPRPRPKQPTGDQLQLL
ncbi:MAG: UvrD-helicase domain-containing protein [Egibacteraceae bacterium]